MKRRTRWILGLGIGIPLALVAVAALLLLLSDTDPESTLSSIDVKDLPSDWETADPAASAAEDEAEVIAPDPAAEARTIESIGLPLTGTLVMTGDGTPFGEETYTLSLQDGVAVLHASGEFWFKALIATITIGFEQTLEMDRTLRPRGLTASFDGPLGFDRKLRADVGASSASVTSGDEVRQIDLHAEDLFVVNTFSTYALVPLLFELRQPDEAIDFETLLLGGPPSAGDPDDSAELPMMKVERTTDGTIRYQGRDLPVARYRISGDTGEMILYARGIEVLGVYAGDEDGSLFVYRADYFDGGFEISADDLGNGDT